jgi:hypothetical protein
MITQHLAILVTLCALAVLFLQILVSNGLAFSLLLNNTTLNTTVCYKGKHKIQKINVKFYKIIQFVSRTGFSVLKGHMKPHISYCLTHWVEFEPSSERELGKQSRYSSTHGAVFVVVL